MDIALASFISLASAGGLFHFGQSAFKEIRNYRDLEKAQTYSPGRLLNEFNNKGLAFQAEKSAQHAEEYKIKGFIEGLVQCDAPVKSQINKKANLIHSIYYREDAFPSNITSQRDLSVPANNEDIDIRAPLIFKLTDPYTKESCQVHRSLEVNANHALEQIGEFTVYEKLDVLDKILYYIGKFTQRFSSANRSGTTVRGIKIGWTEKEFGIKVGGALTVFGDIVFNSKDKSIRIDSPLYYLCEKSSLLKELRRKVLGLKGKVIILSMVFAISSIYMVKGFMAVYKRYQAKKLIEEADKLKLIKVLTLENDYRCVKCLERPRSVIIKPCLHFSLCRTCYHEMSVPSCPICKKAVVEAVEVFFT